MNPKQALFVKIRHIRVNNAESFRGALEELCDKHCYKRQLAILFQKRQIGFDVQTSQSKT